MPFAATATTLAQVAEGGGTLLTTLVRVAALLAGTFVLNRLVRRAIREFVESLHGDTVRKRLFRLKTSRTATLLRTSATPTARAAQRAETIGALLRSTATFVLWSFAALMVLGEFGINLGPLVAGAGIVGVALGFGAQNLVRDFLAGIFMLIEDQYGVGDVVDVGEASGVVEGISLRTTRLRDVQGNVWHVPNGNIARVANMSQQWSRALVDVDIAYSSDIDAASALIADVANGLRGEAAWRLDVLDEPEVWGVERLGPDGVTIRLAVKTRPAAQWSVARELRARIRTALDAAGIDTAVPRRLVYHAESASAR